MTLICTSAVLIFSGSFAYAEIFDGRVAYFPFNGNAYDESGNGNNGTVHEATLVTDKDGIPNGAFQFDGVDDHIQG